MIKLSPFTGEVFWSRHFMVEASNTFNLQAFPFDRQELSLKITSYSYNDDQLVLDWSPEGPVFPDIATMNLAIHRL